MSDQGASAFQTGDIPRCHPGGLPRRPRRSEPQAFCVPVRNWPFFLERFVQSPSVHRADSREESAGETESRVRTSRRQHQGISGGRVPDLCREQGGCTANCESCPRVRVPFARKELWAIFFLCCFQAAVGVCPRGARGRSGCLGAQQGTPRLLVRALKLSLAVPGLQPPTANCRSFSLGRAGESQERRARGLGKSPAETWTAAQAQANPARSRSWRPTHPARTAGRGASRPR